MTQTYSHGFELSKLSFGFKILFFLLISFASLCLGLFIGFLFLKPLFGISFQEVALMTENFQDPKNIAVLRFLQIVQTIFLFIVSSILFYYFTRNDRPKTEWFAGKLTLIIILALVFLTIAWLPITDFLATLNQKMSLPSFLSEIEKWMKEKEETATELTIAMLKMGSIAEFSYVLFLVALLPAIGEELFFRGSLQPLLIGMFKNSHAGVWICAIIFSAIHVQFYGFIPRMMLGVVFGYLFLWTGNIWVPIIGHFINNGAAVIASYIFQLENPEKVFDATGTFSLQLTIIGFAIAIPLLTYFYQKRIQNSTIVNESEYGKRLG